MPGHHRGRPPRNKGRRYPPDPPAVEEIVAVVRCAGESSFGLRTRALIVVLWRAGLRISEALALAESDLDLDRGALLVRRGKGGKRREVGMDAWAWQHLQHWLDVRVELPVGALLCIISGRTADRSWAAPAARCCLRQLAVQAGVRRRFAPHQLRHAHAVEMAREGVPLNAIQRQLGHTDLGVTSIYLQGIDNSDHRDRSRPARADTAGERRPSGAARHLAAPVTPPLAREGGHAPPGVPEPREAVG
jgi:site-specific recombinase XerD